MAHVGGSTTPFGVRAYLLIGLLVAGCAELRSASPASESDPSTPVANVPDASAPDGHDGDQSPATASVQPSTSLGVPTLLLATRVQRNDLGQVTLTPGQNRLSVVLPLPLAQGAQSATQIGPCTLWQGSRGAPLPPPAPFSVADADLGTVTVVGASSGIDVFSRVHDPTDGPGYVSTLDADQPVFRGGEELTFDVTGGADFPAVHMTMTMPSPPILTLPSAPFTPGADYEAHWPANDVLGKVTLTLTTESNDASAVAVCTATDVGAFTIPAAVTERLFPSQQDLEAHLRIERAYTQLHGVYEWQASIADERTLPWP